MITAKLAVVLVALLSIAPAKSNVLQAVDVQRVFSLRTKLYTAVADVTQAASPAKGPVSDCLGLIHDRGLSVELDAAAVGDLIALAATMKDASDELLVLRALRPWLIVLTTDLAHAREIINGTMSLCSSSATVNVKGQTLLNVLSDWDAPVAALSKRVMQVIPPK